MKKDSVKWMDDLPTNPWTKLLRKDLLDKIETPFLDISNFNDVFFSIIALIDAERISFLGDEKLIYRRNREGQLSKRLIPQNLAICLDEYIKYAKERYDSFDFESGLFKLLRCIFECISACINEPEGLDTYMLTQQVLRANNINAVNVSKELFMCVNYFETGNINTQDYKKAFFNT